MRGREISTARASETKLMKIGGTLQAWRRFLYH
jgi:hypothetical protein